MGERNGDDDDGEDKDDDYDDNVLRVMMTATTIACPHGESDCVLTEEAMPEVSNTPNATDLLHLRNGLH